MFYDQFGRLKPYQIALVSIGVAILLLGVWVVSAIQPTGQGGVDVGTWVEEEDELESTDESPLLGANESPRALESETDPLGNPSVQTPVMLESTVLSNPLSPPTPLSPTTRSRFRHRGPRYGTLIPELVHPGAPTGFSIGLGAASPGFVLRPGSMSLLFDGETSGSGTFRRLRTRSEGPAGIEAIMRGDAAEQEDRENQAEATLRHWERPADNAERRNSWWRRLIKRGEGKIRLEEGSEGG